MSAGIAATIDARETKAMMFLNCILEVDKVGSGKPN